MAKRNANAAEDTSQQLSLAFSNLCRIAGYYAHTTPDTVKDDFQDDIKDLHFWPGYVRSQEQGLSRDVLREFRLQTKTIKPLVNRLWKALNKAQKCNRRKNWDTFIDHMAEVWECCWDLLKALDCD